MKIRVTHPDNFYNGREGEVLRTTIIGLVEVNWVRVATSGGGTVEFALLPEYCEPIVDGDTA